MTAVHFTSLPYQLSNAVVEEGRVRKYGVCLVLRGGLNLVRW